MTRQLLFVLLFLAAPLRAAAAGEESAATPDAPAASGAFSGAGGAPAFFDLEAKSGEDRSLGRAALRLPFFRQGDTLGFGELRGMLDDDDALEGNAGVGLRRLVRADGGGELFPGLVAGAYAFYDRRRSAWDNEYDQLAGGAPPADALERCLLRPVQRDVDVVVGVQDISLAPGTAGGPEELDRATVPVRDPRTGRAMHIYFVDADGSRAARGTQAEPLTLAQAERRAGISDIIFLLNGAGRIPIGQLADSMLDLKPCQTLAGVGQGPVTRLPVPGGALTIRAPAGRPWLEGPLAGASPRGASGGPLAWLASGNLVRGLGARGGTMAFAGRRVDDVVFEDVAIEDTARAGIKVHGGRNLTVRGCRLRRTGLAGHPDPGAADWSWLDFNWPGAIMVRDLTGRVEFLDNRVLNPGDYGIFFLGRRGETRLLARGNRIVNAEIAGISAYAALAGRLGLAVAGNSVTNDETRLPGPPPPFGRWGRYAIDAGSLYGGRAWGELRGNYVAGTAALEMEFGLTPLAENGGRTVIRVAGNRVSHCLLAGVWAEAFRDDGQGAVTRLDVHVSGNVLSACGAAGGRYGAVFLDCWDLLPPPAGAWREVRVYGDIQGNFLPGQRVALDAEAGYIGVERLASLGARNGGAPVFAQLASGGRIGSLPEGFVREP